MTLSLSQLRALLDAAQPVAADTRARKADTENVTRQFRVVTFAGRAVGLPVARALAWMRATGAETLTLERGALRGHAGTSQIRFATRAGELPCGAPWTVRAARLWTNSGTVGRGYVRTLPIAHFPPVASLDDAAPVSAPRIFSAPKS